MSKIQRLLKEAIKEAKKSDLCFRVGAVVFRGPTIISRGHNSNSYLDWAKTTHKYPTRHAELDAINNVSRDLLRGAGIFVVRLTRKGDLSCAKPCKDCLYKLLKSGITKIYYTDFSGNILKLELKTLENYTKDIK